MFEKFWEKWRRRKEEKALTERLYTNPLEYDQFTAEFAESFYKQNRELFIKDPVEYWHLFRQERDSAWREYQKK